MKIVVADATPVHYLILIDATHILPSLFHTIHVPGQVRDELTHAATPDPVKIWMRHAPEWLGIVPTTLNPETSSVLAALDVGEQGAITLAESLRADLLLIDDRAGAEIAERRGLSVTGTLGVLDLAARKALIDLRIAFDRLQQTNFRYPPSLMERLLRERTDQSKGDT